MTSRKIFLAVAALAATACVTPANGLKGAPEGVPRDIVQADHPFVDAATMGPLSVLFDNDLAVSYFNEASEHESRAQAASEEKETEKARREYAAGADGYAKFADKFPRNRWSLRVRYEAALLYLRAQNYEQAAHQAKLVHDHKGATRTTQALAARLEIGAVYRVAEDEVKAGKLEGRKFLLAEERAGQPVSPRVPPEWKAVEDATDDYLAVADAEPKPPSLGTSPTPAYFAETAAEISFAFDDMLGARRRFELFLDRYPQYTDYLRNAVSLYLETFLVLGDEAGHDAAAARLRPKFQGLLEKAPPEKKEAYERVLTTLKNTRYVKRFVEAEKELDEGKFEQAALEFENLAAEPEDGDTVNALNNAASAWHRAGHPEKALVIRNRIASAYPDSRWAPANQFYIAQDTLELKKYEESVKLYRQYLARWPSDPYRCVALQNIASALDTLKKRADAAEAYLLFGTDPACRRSDANLRVKALYRGGVLFEKVKRPERAKEAFSAVLELKGITDPQAKDMMDDARKRGGK